MSLIGRYCANFNEDGNIHAAEHSDIHVPNTSLSTFPQPIASLHKLEYVTFEYHCLHDVCKNVSLTVTVLLKWLSRLRPKKGYKL